MFKIKSVTGRIFVGVSIGFVAGVLFILAVPTFNFPVMSAFAFGTLILFVLMGLTLGLVGIYDRHPIFGFKMTWYLRGAVIGFIFYLMYILLGYNSFEAIMKSNLVSWTGLSSPFWALLDGVSLGLIMAYMETKIAGEGSELPLK